MATTVPGDLGTSRITLADDLVLEVICPNWSTMAVVEVVSGATVEMAFEGTDDAVSSDADHHTIAVGSVRGYEWPPSSPKKVFVRRATASSTILTVQAIARIGGG